jgi:hypothetical protein
LWSSVSHGESTALIHVHIVDNIGSTQLRDPQKCRI